ncbi:hypothetical protein [Nocardia noduli]|uniref:hypothetical protein n=1 Tax=Nocardia noduli TaxID=2815722 RepID=UPI001C24C038|nr:hypothetical protein [Nocardia noduli]
MRHTTITSLTGVGLFEMTLDSGRLPVQVTVRKDIHRVLNPDQFAAAAMTSYYLALWQHDAATIARGDFAALSARPRRRALITTLLGTRNRAEFESVERAAHGDIEFVGTGPITDFGAPSVRIAAGLGRIDSIEIDRRWAVVAQPPDIGYDIIECANQIRQQRPTFRVDDSWANLSDEALEQELEIYRDYMNRNF